MSKNVLNNRNIYVIFSITLIAVMGVASLTPALPKIAKELNLDNHQIGLLISAFTFPGIFLTPVTGVIADRFGRKKVLIPSLFIFAIAGFSIFFIRHFEYIIAFRFLQGIGAASLGSLNTTLIGDYFKGKDRPEAMGLNASVLSLSTASYPLIGGILASIAWYYPFILPLLAIPVGFFVLFGIQEPGIEKQINYRQYFSSMKTTILRKEVISIFILGILTFIILYGAFLTYLPFVLSDKFNFDSRKIGILLSLSSVMTAIVATQVGKLTNKYGSMKILKLAFIFYFFVTISIPFINDIFLFIFPIFLFGAAQAFNIPSLQTLLANLAPDNQRGIFMSLNGMNLRLGQTLGPLIIGLGFSIKGIEGAYVLASVIAIFGFAILLNMKNISKNKINQN